MAIQILPPQLANQIAAGEVVERPASVVKELVENSLDAGANRIQVDIENGGASLIRVRDNGVGIAKEELSLALARHATSKILCLEDLEAILSLGFRGEALASISSVSRLTLTSRTAEQSEAWQVYAQGREMETTIQPASHPVGTTVEVANLFFNTPARRKFLRTDKTEFAHIDEVIRRIALAKPQIAFSLSHNNKPIRQYKSAVDFPQKLKRLGAICGQDFVAHALHIDWKHGDLHLTGWVALPQFSRPQNDLAYSYVNGRMVRDKVINHAIRQAYSDRLPAEHYPAFVLFLDLNPNEVDVNVHPTKHEVRFQQSRLIHDFIYQGIVNALDSQQTPPLAPDFSPKAADDNQDNLIAEPAPRYENRQPNRAAAGQNRFAQSPAPRPTVSKTEQQLYRRLLQTDSAPTPAAQPAQQQPPQRAKSAVVFADFSVDNPHLRALSLVENKALLLQKQQQLFLLPLRALQQLKLRLSLQQKDIARQNLLIPLSLRLDSSQLAQWETQKSYFAQIGLEYEEYPVQQRLSITAVPQCLRQQNLQHWLLALLAHCPENFSQFLTALCEQIPLQPVESQADAVNLLHETEQLTASNPALLTDLLIRLDLSPYLND